MIKPTFYSLYSWICQFNVYAGLETSKGITGETEIVFVMASLDILGHVGLQKICLVFHCVDG
jgi:hypothetical protein